MIFGETTSEAMAHNSPRNDNASLPWLLDFIHRFSVLMCTVNLSQNRIPLLRLHWSIEKNILSLLHRTSWQMFQSFYSNRLISLPFFHEIQLIFKQILENLKTSTTKLFFLFYYFIKHFWFEKTLARVRNKITSWFAQWSYHRMTHGVNAHALFTQTRPSTSWVS